MAQGRPETAPAETTAASQGGRIAPEGMTAADLRAECEALPGIAGARLWVYGGSSSLQGAEDRIGRVLGLALRDWNSHGLALAGHYRILEHRFLVVFREPLAEGQSGCSIDFMQNAVVALEKELGTALLDSSRIFYRDADGGIECVDRPTFKEHVRAGRVGPDTPVFDLVQDRLESLWNGSFEKPLRDSWHQRLYANALKGLPTSSPK